MSPSTPFGEVRLEVLLTESQGSANPQVREAFGAGEFIHGGDRQPEQLGYFVRREELMVKPDGGIGHGGLAAAGGISDSSTHDCYVHQLTRLALFFCDMDMKLDEDPWLTLSEVSAELRVHPSTVRLWVSNGRLAAVRAGGRKWRVRRSEVDRMLGEDVSPGYSRQAPAPASTAEAIDPYAPPVKRPGEWVIDTTAGKPTEGS